MGLQWLKFRRRRKYSRVLGGQAHEPLHWSDPFIDSHSKGSNRNIRTNKQNWPPPAHIELHRNGNIDDLEFQNSRKNDDDASQWPRFAKKRPHLNLFGLRLRIRRAAAAAAHGPPPEKSGKKAAARVAVENFLAGPAQVGDEGELYQRQCREMLRKLSARGNRVPGFM